MNRVSAAILIVLVAIAAVEFGLLGASAAGIRGGGSDLPPVGERFGEQFPTPTPFPFATATWTPGPQSSPPQLSPPSAVGGITILPNPLAIRCDGTQSSRVVVRILDPTGFPFRTASTCTSRPLTAIRSRTSRRP